MMASPSLNYQDVRVTDSHIYFWHSILSNFYQAHKFPGIRAMEILLHRLDERKMSHPEPYAESTALIAEHSFNCGEQFIMACKAWLFETDPNFPMLKAILGKDNPADQKALGRKISGFVMSVWTPASTEIVVALLITRTEVDRQLLKLYKDSGNRIFVEGSPTDKIWGVGIHFKNNDINDEGNWRGENRLGYCHGIARDCIQQQDQNHNYTSLCLAIGATFNVPDEQAV